jgi:hypothetical protein
MVLAFTLYLDSSWHSSSHWMPAIMYIGQSGDNVTRRVRLREKEEKILFDGARTVFIEHKRMRRLIERLLIYWYRNPESGHSDSLQNLR